MNLELFHLLASAFKRHPLGDVGGGICYCDTLVLAGIEKSDSFNADQRYGAYIHDNVATGSFDLCPNLIQVFYAQGANKLKNYPSPQRLFVNPEYHQSDRPLDPAGEVTLAWANPAV